jgi:hypothetical protein
MAFRRARFVSLEVKDIRMYELFNDMDLELEFSKFLLLDQQPPVDLTSELGLRGYEVERLEQAILNERQQSLSF